MIRRMIVAASLLGLTMAAEAAVAQQPQTPTAPDTARFGNPTGIARKYQSFLYGVVKTVDQNEMVLEKTKFGIDQAFKFDRKTKFIHDGKPSAWDKLKNGDKVWVDVHKDKKTGDLIAKKVVTGVDVVAMP